MSAVEVRVATAADRARVVRTLVAAFTTDPVLRWLFPDDDAYPGHAGAFFGYLFDRRVARETVWTVEDGASVALWEAPASARAPSAGGETGGGLFAVLPADAAARLRAYDEAVHTAMPTSAFWYLGVLGTDPEHAGRRWGRAVMQAGLRRAADAGVPAMLETSNPVNVGIYRRAGWEVVREVTRPLPVWLMERPPPRPDSADDPRA